MRKGGFISLILIIMLLVVAFLWTGVLPLHAQGDPGIIWKLGKLLENQSEILRSLSEIKNDLRAIKAQL